MDCTIAENLDNCPCSYEPCERKGKCCECVAHHRAKGQITACFFSNKGEQTHNRSIQNFIKDQKDY